MLNRLYKVLAVALIAVLSVSATADSKKSRKKRARRYYPPVTHPVVLWARTLKTSTDIEARKVAAFKLSAYTQPIFQEEVVSALLDCIGDEDIKIRVWCT